MIKALKSFLMLSLPVDSFGELLYQGISMRTRPNVVFHRHPKDFPCTIQPRSEKISGMIEQSIADLNSK